MGLVENHAAQEKINKTNYPFSPLFDGKKKRIERRWNQPRLATEPLNVIGGISVVAPGKHAM